MTVVIFTVCVCVCVCGGCDKDAFYAPFLVPRPMSPLSPLSLYFSLSSTPFSLPFFLLLSSLALFLSLFLYLFLSLFLSLFLYLFLFLFLFLFLSFSSLSSPLSSPLLSYWQSPFFRATHCEFSRLTSRFSLFFCKKNRAKDGCWMLWRYINSATSNHNTGPPSEVLKGSALLTKPLPSCLCSTN